MVSLLLISCWPWASYLIFLNVGFFTCKGEYQSLDLISCCVGQMSFVNRAYCIVHPNRWLMFFWGWLSIVPINSLLALQALECPHPALELKADRKNSPWSQSWGWGGWLRPRRLAGLLHSGQWCNEKLKNVILFPTSVLELCPIFFPY